MAMAFAAAYERGDTSASQYVWYDGPHVGDMGGTPEELEKELLPAELKKNAKDPAEAKPGEVVFSENDAAYGHDVWYVSYDARGKTHKLCLHKVDGTWKVDLSYLWMGDWYDWMPGY